MNIECFNFTEGTMGILKSIAESIWEKKSTQNSKPLYKGHLSMKGIYMFSLQCPL
jgi:hypothetical protein